MKNNFRRNLLVSFGVSLLILVISSGASLLSIRSLLDSTQWVNHTQDVIYNLNTANAVMVDAQTSVRGYLITGNQDFLEEYVNSEANTNRYFDKLEQLTEDNHDQQLNLQELKPLRSVFFKYLRERVDQKSKGRITMAEDLNAGKNMMANIRSVMKRMESEEQRLLDERNGTSSRYATYSIVLIIAAAIVALLISGLFFMRILTDYSERSKLHQQLKEKDEETAERLRVVSKIASQIAEGDYTTRVDDTSTDALGSVGISLNNMAQELETSFSNLSDNEWLQSGIAGLNNAMIGEKGMDQLTSDIIQFLSEYTNSNAGVLYLRKGDDLHAIAGYSHKLDKSREYIALGEGLTGQAARSNKIMELKGLLPDDIHISFATGEAKPKHVVAIPLTDIEVEGTAELAAIREYTAREMAFLAAASKNIGISLKAAQNRARVQELLEETQSQAEELQAQHSELEGMNAELEAQTEKLQASEEELKVQQEELQQTNEELAERSVLLEERNTEIRKKSEDLERTTKYKSEFLANMSHELRTPLNSILLLSRLLSDNNDNNMTAEQTEFARVIQSSGNGLLGLIDEILDLSKIEAGKMELEFLEVPVQEILDTLKSLFGEVARQKNIEFNIISSAAPLVIRTDRMRLEQILKNLISNAIKFTSEGSVTLEVTSLNSKTVKFAVKDTGIGIPFDKQPLIFEAFQQADGSTKRKYGGTGLGLSISRELARLLSGEIKLQSKPGSGSEFSLAIPISGTAVLNTDREYSISLAEGQSENAEEAIPQMDNRYLSKEIPNDVPDDRETISPKDKVMLIVEDDTNFAKSLLDFSRKRGYKGVVTVRGDQALNLALAYKPVGILLDIQLPIKSGWEVMEELKGNSQTRPIPVHIMSSHHLRQESLLKGAVNFLDKPVAFDQIPEIFLRIERIVNRESQKVLIIEDNPQHAKALSYFLDTHKINSEIRSEISEGIASLQKEDVNCVILDMGIPDKQAYEILENVKKNPGLENLPVIVFTGKSLSLNEEVRIKQYADSIIVKTAHSYQRMLDEVSLFLHIVEEKKPGGRKQAAEKTNLLNNILHDKTVLVVDDDVRNIYSLSKALEGLKMNVLTAIDGKEAMKMLAAHPGINLVLLDMMMPNMDGYETATAIRSDKKFKNLPVIAVTAKAMTGDREKCINAGASDYITKPVDIDQLLSLLRVWLYNKI